MTFFFNTANVNALTLWAKILFVINVFVYFMLHELQLVTYSFIFSNKIIKVFKKKMKKKIDHTHDGR